MDEFVYLGSFISKKDEWDEISRRITLAWGSFSKHKNILKNKNMKMKYVILLNS